MPLDFDTAEKIINRAKITRFRDMREDETLGQYRQALVDHVASVDPIEAHEIRTGKGWDKWTDEEFEDFMTRHPDHAARNPMCLTRMIEKGLR